jgi:hypothetical protein
MAITSATMILWPLWQVLRMGHTHDTLE